MTGDDEEITPEALQQLNALLDQAPGEGATEEEAEAFMKKFSETPGGQAMLQSLTKELANGGGGMLESLLGQGGEERDREFDPSLYQKPSSSLRLVFRIQVVGSQLPHWRRITLPADACFFDLHYALQDAFEVRATLPHRFEWREGEKVVATFLTGAGEAREGDDYCGFQNRPLDLFSEGAERLFYCRDEGPIPVFAIFMEKLIDQNSFEISDEGAPECIGGEGPTAETDLRKISFRAPGES